MILICFNFIVAKEIRHNIINLTYRLKSVQYAQIQNMIKLNVLECILYLSNNILYTKRNLCRGERS